MPNFIVAALNIKMAALSAAAYYLIEDKRARFNT